MTAKSIRVITGALALLACTNALQAQTAIWSYSTGQDTAVGQIDESVVVHYNYTNSVVWDGGSWGIGTSDVYAIDPVSGQWYNSQPLNWISAPGDSKWTSVSTNGKTSQTGTYTFTYTFNNTSGLTDGLFSMNYAVDDKVTDILLNGISIYGDLGPTGTWTEISTLSDIAVSLLAGENTFEVVVRNNNPEWVALAAEYQIVSSSTGVGNGNAAVPEPSTSLLAILGTTWFVVCGRSRRRN
jgi:hypothetical protein